VNIDLPVRDVKTGPTVTDEINVPAPAASGDVTRLTLGFGAGVLRLSPGEDDALVSGTATYNVEDLKPIVTTDGDQVTIDSGDLEIRGIPDFGDNYKNEWDLNLGSEPMDLTINAGAYQGIFDLGGLSLSSLEISDGAADVDLEFSEPNLIEMDSFQYKTGASNVVLNGLANANFETLSFKGGAGDYTLDFSGELKRDATVTIDAGISSFKVIVPEGTSARVFFDGGLSNIDISGDWERDGNDYVQAGDGPMITINVNMGAGNLELRNN
jgi:hypothetical protein